MQCPRYILVQHVLPRAGPGSDKTSPQILAHQFDITTSESRQMWKLPISTIDVNDVTLVVLTKICKLTREFRVLH